MSVLESVRQLEHTPTCASGARAETRSTCDCDAASRAPLWTIDILAARDAQGRHLISVTTQPLSWLDACSLELALHDVQLRTAALWTRDTERRERAAQRAQTRAGERVEAASVDGAVAVATADDESTASPTTEGTTP